MFPGRQTVGVPSAMGGDDAADDRGQEVAGALGKSGKWKAEKVQACHALITYFSNARTSCAVSAHCWRRTRTPPSNVQTCAKRAANVLPVALARPE